MMIEAEDEIVNDWIEALAESGLVGIDCDARYAFYGSESGWETFSCGHGVE